MRQHLWRSSFQIGSTLFEKTIQIKASRYLHERILLMKILALAMSLLLSFATSVSFAKTASSDLETSLAQLKNYDGLSHAKVMVVGTFHFDKTMLSSENQAGITRLNKLLSQYKPTKIILEWEPSRQESMNSDYRKYLANQFDISQKPNEVYQLGFQLAKQLKHQQLYLFDNQTEYLGSLENFSFESFTDYAKSNDDGFYNQFEKQLIDNFEFNQKLIAKLPVEKRIAVLNAPQKQKINEQRMHMYEVRVGIQKNWIGPDWLARWYQRNIRMAGNVLKLAEDNDRLLIIVGDNHKWVLDSLFEKTPDLEMVSSWKYFNQ